MIPTYLFILLNDVCCRFFSFFFWSLLDVRLVLEWSYSVFIHKSTRRIDAFNLLHPALHMQINIKFQPKFDMYCDQSFLYSNFFLANCTCTSIILAAVDWRTCTSYIWYLQFVHIKQYILHSIDRSIDRVWFCSAQHHTAQLSTRFHIHSHYAPFLVNAHLVSFLFFYFTSFHTITSVT